MYTSILCGKQLGDRPCNFSHFTVDTSDPIHIDAVITDAIA